MVSGPAGVSGVSWLVLCSSSLCSDSCSLCSTRALQVLLAPEDLLDHQALTGPKVLLEA